MSGIFAQLNVGGNMSEEDKPRIEGAIKGLDTVERILKTWCPIHGTLMPCKVKGCRNGE